MTTISNGTQTLDLNPDGMYMNLNSFTVMTIWLHSTHTVLFILSKNMTLISDKNIQEFLRNSGIGCLLRKMVFGIKHQNQPRQEFCETIKHPISLVLIPTFMMLPLMIL